MAKNFTATIGAMSDKNPGAWVSATGTVAANTAADAGTFNVVGTLYGPPGFTSMDTNVLYGKALTTTPLAVAAGLTLPANAPAGTYVFIWTVRDTVTWAWQNTTQPRVAFQSPVRALTLSAVVTPSTAPSGAARNLTQTASGGTAPYTHHTPTATGVTFTPVAGQPGQWTFTCMSTITITCTATDAASVTASTTVTATQSGGLPAGVSLQAIDGGPTYYADHGFTYAVNGGWDSPSFFPIGIFLERCDFQSDADIIKDLNLNFMAGGFANDTTFSVMRSNNLFLIIQESELATLIAHNGGANPGSETVGVLGNDEPNSYAEVISGRQNISNAIQNNRFWHQNYTHNQIHGFDVEGHAMNTVLSELIATPNATTRHLDIAGIDQYWVSIGGNDPNNITVAMYNGAKLTDDQVKRGARYGDVVDWQRLGNPVWGHPKWQATYPAPTYTFIETCGADGANNTVAKYIQPPELNAAAWSTIIHGARMMQYYPHTFGTAGGDNIIGGTFYKQIFPGQTISIYNQLKATNALIKSLAPVLNSPFALGYVTVSPAGWKFGDAAQSAFNGSGFDVMAKYYNVAGGDNTFYVFAMPRYSAASLNQTATFTIADTTKTTATVIGESRTRPISGGVFTDTFANGHTVHIYKIS